MDAISATVFVFASCEFVQFLGASLPAYHLTYQFQRESLGNRGHRGANKVRERLGWKPGIANLLGEKPKGMHWKTYLRLLTKQKKYANQVYVNMMEVLKKVDERVAILVRDLNI